MTGNGSAEKDNCTQRRPGPLPDPSALTVLKRSVSDLSTTSPFGVKTTFWEACAPGLVQTLLTTTASVGTTFALHFDHNRSQQGTQKHTCVKASLASLRAALVVTQPGCHGTLGHPQPL